MRKYQSVSIFNKIANQIEDFNISNISKEKWNSEYEAISMQVNDVKIKSRLAKKTNKKKGQFLSVWTKDDENKNRSFTFKEIEELLVVNIIEGRYYGQFVFPKMILLKQQILMTTENKGKMAFRVYPPWDKDLNNTAAKTQKWQNKYFVDLTTNIDKNKIKKLYNLN